MFIQILSKPVLLVLAFCLLMQTATLYAATPEPLPLQIKGNIIRHEVFFLPLMPNARVRIKSAMPDKSQVLTAESSEGVISNIRRRSFVWAAPKKPGKYPVNIRDDKGRSVQLKMLVMVPASEQVDGHLNGYRIGKYPTTALRGMNIYTPPRGFIEVNREDAQTYISPHFRLGQFVCKQEGDFPKYIVLRPELVLMLERLAAPLGENAVKGLHIMSGYRTPYYNAVIGNGEYSRHLWGGAADVFIDIDPHDGIMDDLNSDGTINKHDADVLFKRVEDMLENQTLVNLVGGLSSYSATSSHGPFLHVDVRGFKARW